MAVRTVAAAGPFAIGEAALARLEKRAARAVALRRREGGSAIAAVTVPLDPELDLSAAVLAARADGERAFCLEQPDRGGFVLAGLGAAAVVEARGPGRFAEAAERARELGRRTFADDPAGDPLRPQAAGPVLVAASPSPMTVARAPSGPRCRRRRWCCPRSCWPATGVRPG